MENFVGKKYKNRLLVGNFILFGFLSLNLYFHSIYLTDFYPNILEKF